MPDYGGGGRHGMGGDRSGLGGQNRGGEGRQRQLEKQRELQRKADIANQQRVAQQKANAAAAAAAQRQIQQRQADEAAAARAELNRLREQRLADEKAAKAREDARNRELAEAEAARKQKLAEERQARLQKEEQEAAATRQLTTDRTQSNLSESLVNKLAPDTLKALLAGGHGISGNVFGGLDDDTKNKVQDVLSDINDDTARQANRLRAEVDQLSRLGAYGNLTPNEAATFSDRASTSMGLLTNQQRQELTNRGFDLDNLAYTPGQGLLGLQQQALIRDTQTGEIIGRPNQGLMGPAGAGLAALGIDTSGINFGTDLTQDRGGRQDERLAGIPIIAQTEGQEDGEEDGEEDSEDQEQVFTGDLRGTSPGFTTSMGGTGITSTPSAGNYMDYMNYAFRPVNLATPFRGQPTQQIMGSNPLFGANPVYRAHGGRVGRNMGGIIGFMDEPINIMYPSNQNNVLHGGISSILKKYKEIRSEL